jgi:glycerophosphoryl diester phosphodiesterase
MKIVGHRGAKGLAPENTIQSLETALKHNVDMIEVDVRLQGKQLVLSHDPTLPTAEYTLLQDALNIVKGQVPLNLEIKEERAVALLPAFLKKYTGVIIFSSFEFSVLQEIKKTIPNAEIAVLEKWSGIRAVAKASLLETNRIYINQAWLWGSFVKSLIHRGYDLYAYTVNETERAEELREWGVQGIFTDYPDRFR